MRVLAGALLLLVFAVQPAHVPERRSPAARAATVRLLFAGDVMLGRGVGKVAEADPLGLFADVHSVVSGADLAVANLESPLTSRPHLAANPNALEARPETASLLVKAGFDAMGVTNNHAGDAGPASVLDTVATLKKAGIVPVGGGADRGSALAPRVLVRGGLRIALLAFDATGQGLPAGEHSPGVALWDETRAREAVRLAKASSDIVVVGLHGGGEYRPVADPFIAGISRRLADWGADVVWGHGPHVVQPITLLSGAKGRPTVVATSLGNFLFDQNHPGTREGAVLEVLAAADGVRAWRTGATEHHDRRVHFQEWQLPKGDAAALDGRWWELARPVHPARKIAPINLSPLVRQGALILDAAIGDVTGDGIPEVVASFRRSSRGSPAPFSAPPDPAGRTAHVGVYQTGSFHHVWGAGSVARPVGKLAVCTGDLAVAYLDRDPGAQRGGPTVGAGAWRWNGFGFAALPDLEGPGLPACADVDLDGHLDPIVTGRVST
ncbi:MAG: CapA family protein [Actinomycetota bacterium]